MVSPREPAEKLGLALVQIGEERQVLREVVLDGLHALVCQRLDPTLGEVLFDVMEDAAVFHAAIVGKRSDVCMSRTAYFFG
jgi:hypothetical protein